MRTITSWIDGRDNNFNLIRFLAAFIVIVDHSYALADSSWNGPALLFPWGLNPGRIAIYIFFITSGFLVTMSFSRKRSTWLYLEARGLRIIPALVVSVLFCALVIGPLFTTLSSSAYLSHRSVYEYIVINSALILKVTQLKYVLPGVFTENPTPYTVNGSLWTLPYEMWLYLLIVLIGTARLLNKRNHFNLFFLVLLVAYLGGMTFFSGTGLFQKIDLYLTFGILFLLGGFYFLNRDSIPLNGFVMLALWVPTFLLKDFGILHKLVFWLSLSYTVFWLAFVPGGWIRRFNHIGDYSYGLYIYAYPVQQSIIALVPKIDPLPLLYPATFVTLILAVISWHAIEKPALQQKGFSERYAARWARRVP